MQPPQSNFETPFPSSSISSTNAIVVLQYLNTYLSTYDPLHLIVIGAALMASMLIVMPRIGYFVASAVFLVVASDTICCYYKDVSYQSLEEQAPYIVFLTVFACMQLYCAVKVLKWL